MAEGEVCQRCGRFTPRTFLVFFLFFITTFFVFRVAFAFRLRLAGVGLISSSAANSSTPSCEPVAATLAASTTSPTASPIIPTIECGFFFAISPTSLVQKYRVTSHGRLAGYDDVNDAERLRHDPASTAHGLRKAAARRLAEAGCTMHEIAAITGHASLSEVQRYTRAADQARLARAAMDKAK